MATIVLRVRLLGGERLDVTFDGPHDVEESRVIVHVVDTLAEASGVVRCKHGDQLVVLYGRGVAALEVAPRGAVV
jgi:hypothetical protein